MIMHPFASSSKLGIIHSHFRYLTVCQVAGDRIWRGSGPSPWPDLPLEDIYGTDKALRLRQHINPLKRQHQVPIDPPDWHSVYGNARLPLVLDIGCAGGRYLLALANKLEGINLLGIDIREPLIGRANQWAAKLGKQDCLFFISGNATVSLRNLLASYPGPINLVSIQFPDPHFKNRNKKRRIVQPQVIKDLGDLLQGSKGHVFLQSDVEDVTAAMRDEFEMFGAQNFCLANEHLSQSTLSHSTLTVSPGIPPNDEQNSASSEQDELLPGRPSLREANQNGAEPQTPARVAVDGESAFSTGPTDSEDLEPDLEAWRSLTWQKAGYLQQNPMGIPTEREVQTLGKGLPVFRVLLRRR